MNKELLKIMTTTRDPKCVKHSSWNLLDRTNVSTLRA